MNCVPYKNYASVSQDKTNVLGIKYFIIIGEHIQNWNVTYIWELEL